MFSPVRQKYSSDFSKLEETFIQIDIHAVPHTFSDLQIQHACSSAAVKISEATLHQLLITITPVITDIQAQALEDFSYFTLPFWRYTVLVGIP